jgi:hypothetical protein
MKKREDPMAFSAMLLMEKSAVIFVVAFPTFNSTGSGTKSWFGHDDPLSSRGHR